MIAAHAQRWSEEPSMTPNPIRETGRIASMRRRLALIVVDRREPMLIILAVFPKFCGELFRQSRLRCHLAREESRFQWAA
jgi:hypothetical protein